MRNQIVALSLTTAGILTTASSSAFAGCSSTTDPATGSITVTCSPGTTTVTNFPLNVSLTNAASLTFNVFNDISYSGVITAPSNKLSNLNFNIGTGNQFTLSNPSALDNFYGEINVISGTFINSLGAINIANIKTKPNNSPTVSCYGCANYLEFSVNAPTSIKKPTQMTLWAVSSTGPTFIKTFTLSPNSSETVQFDQVPSALGSYTFVAQIGTTYQDYTKIGNGQLGQIVTYDDKAFTFKVTAISVNELQIILNSLPANPNAYNTNAVYILLDTKANIIAADYPGGALTRLLNYDPNNKYRIISDFLFTDAVIGLNGLNTMPITGAAGDIFRPTQTQLGRMVTSGSYSPLPGELVHASGNVIVPSIPSGAMVIADGANNSKPQIGSISSGGTLKLISGEANLRSIDGGTLITEDGTTLNGINSAAIAVNSGTASINGTADGQMTVGNTGTLKGSGTVTGQTTIGAGGTLSPGNSPGILNFTSSVTQSSGSTLNIDIDGPTAGNGGGFYSRLSITGAGSSYTIAPNAILTPTLRGITQASISEGVTNTYTPPMGSKFVIVQAAGGVSGTFGTLVQPASGLNTGYRFVDTYPTNAVNLYVVPNSYAAIGASKSVNAGRIASVIDGVRQPTADRGTALGSFYSLPDYASVANALQQLSGYSQTSIVNAAVKGQQAITQTIEERMASLRRDGGLSGSDMSTVLFSDAPLSQTGGAVNTIMRNANMTDGSTPKLSDGRTWMMPIYQFSRGTADTNSSGIKTKTIGAVAGSDFTVDSGAIFGGALSYVENSLDSGDKTTNYGLSVYGLRKLGAFYAAGSIVATYDTFQLSRGIIFSDLSRTANSKVSGYQVNAGGEIGYQQAFGELSASPFIGANIKSINRNSFTESGANALDLSLNAYNKFNLNSKVGVRFSYKMDVSDYAVMPFTEFAWLHDFADPTINLGSNIFATPYTIQGTSYGRDAALVGAGLTISKTDNLKFLAKYAGEFRNKENSNRFNVGVVGKW